MILPPRKLNLARTYSTQGLFKTFKTITNEKIKPQDDHEHVDACDRI
jgi:hypothetical protein